MSTDGLPQAGLLEVSAPSCRRYSPGPAPSVGVRSLPAADSSRAVRPHAEWCSLLLGSVPNVLYLADDDGIVLHSVGSEELMRNWRLEPGYDWSEERMGTNGTGTALAAGRPVAVLGGEHYNQAFSEAACLGAPVHGPEGEMQGVVDLAVPREFGRPRTLLWSVHVAWVAEQELREREGG